MLIPDNIYTSNILQTKQVLVIYSGVCVCERTKIIHKFQRVQQLYMESYGDLEESEGRNDVIIIQSQKIFHKIKTKFYNILILIINN